MRMIAIIFLVSLLTACSDSGDPVYYVFPTGFTGRFVVTEGVSKSGGYVYNGMQHVYSFPQSGVVFVQSTRPLEQWHTTTAAYDDGTAIPWGEFATMKPEQIRYIDLGATSDGEFFGAVGTQEQVESFRQQWNRGELQGTTR